MQNQAAAFDPSLLLMFGALALLVFFMFRNGRKRMKAQEEMRRSLVPGAEVMLNSGIYGTVLEVDEANAQATVQSAGSTLRVHVQAITQVIPEEVGDPRPGDDIVGDTEGDRDPDVPGSDASDSSNPGPRL